MADGDLGSRAGLPLNNSLHNHGSTGGHETKDEQDITDVRGSDFLQASTRSKQDRRTESTSPSRSPLREAGVKSSQIGTDSGDMQQKRQSMGDGDLSALKPIPHEEESIVAEGSKVAGHSTPPELTAQVDQNGATPASPISLKSHNRNVSIAGIGLAAGVSEWSHQQLSQPQQAEIEEKEDDTWQEMPAYAPYDMYNDDNKLVAREAPEEVDDTVDYSNLGGAARGYTKVQMDEDAQSATSMDENTAYLFKETGTHLDEDDDEARDTLTQMQATKDLLTDNQRIAYVGVVRLAIAAMTKQVGDYERTKAAKKDIDNALEAMKMWGQKMMVRIYSHMELDPAEQIMIEQLTEHGLRPSDLTPALMHSSKVQNPVYTASNASHNSIAEPATNGHTNLYDGDPSMSETVTIAIDSSQEAVNGKKPHVEAKHFDVDDDGENDDPVPPYEEIEDDDPGVIDPTELSQSTKNLNIDLRWTVLCDLFLILIMGGVYDARSRSLLEKVGSFLSVEWVDICRFEKRVTDALEVQESANKEDWDEKDHMDMRRKKARNRRLAMMGLATVGGGLVIGLSAGLLAPVIGAGLAAGFTAIGVSGTSTFLAGAGGAAIIGTGGVLAGGTVGVRAANRRTGAVKTFEYRPLHNHKRVNLVITVAGWMNGKVDDVRLPFSTVDPIVGDIYSILWEPEMLRSMGDTINILATEALTQSLQQILGATFLTVLMAGLQLPIVLTKLTYLIDNPWSNSVARADMAGLIFADSLIDRNLGARPITLVGYSLGSRVIFSTLKELAKRGALGLIQNVFLFGTPVVAKKDEYLKARAVVSGRFVNAYATNDWILGYLFRATSGGIMRVAGLAEVNVDGIENMNVTEWVPGHMAYRKAMPRLLRECGWVVESDEFSEIEDPDPDNHEKRQREIINEIEEARKELEKKPEKRRFGLFKKNKKVAEKRAWETYDDRSNRILESDGTQKGEAAGNTIFDIDAIQKEIAEIAKDGIEVRELESTLPPIKISSASVTSLREESPRPNLANTRATKSHDGTQARGSEPAWSDATNGETHDDPEQITMTFETSPQPPHPSNGGVGGNLDTKSGSGLNERLHSSDTDLSRSNANTNSTSPPLNHNVWADEDEDFGKEDVTMTFE